MTLIISLFIVQILILVNVTYKQDEAKYVRSVTYELGNYSWPACCLGGLSRY